jgi:hypothetical protein
MRLRSPGQRREVINVPVLKNRGLAGWDIGQGDGRFADGIEAGVPASQRLPGAGHLGSASRPGTNGKSSRWSWRDETAIGMMRARAKIGLQNLAYNIRRLGDAGTARRGMKVKSFRSCM